MFLPAEQTNKGP